MSLVDRVRWLPGGRALLAHARGELPQKNELCGGFAGLVALRGAGCAVHDQDEVAAAAGTVLLAEAGQSWPPAERGRDDFRLTLSHTHDPARAGTSAVGLAQSITRISGDRLLVVPGSGPWSAERLARLLDAAHTLDGVCVLANVSTAEFGAQDTPARALEDYLSSGLLPMWSSRWQVGHFVLIGGTLAGDVGTLVAIVDTYPSLGENGLHLQPIERVAAALIREGMSPGGLLLVVPAEQEPAAQQVIADAGLCVAWWDNGTPAPEQP